MDFDVALEDLYIGRFIEVGFVESGEVNMWYITSLSLCVAGTV